MLIAQQSSGRKEEEECDENINYTYFEKQYDQTFLLNVLFFLQIIQYACN